VRARGRAARLGAPPRQPHSAISNFLKGKTWLLPVLQRRAALRDPEGPAVPQRGTALVYTSLADAFAAGAAAPAPHGAAQDASCTAEGEQKAQYGADPAARAAALLQRLSAEPVFQQFERCLRLHLSGNPEPSASRRANLLERMPHTLAQQVGGVNESLTARRQASAKHACLHVQRKQRWPLPKTTTGQEAVGILSILYRSFVSFAC